MIPTRDPAVTGATTEGIATKRAALVVFARWWSPRSIALGLVVTTTVRLVVGGWSWWDLYAVGVVFAAVPFVEWVIHLHLLHGEPRSYLGGAVDIGSGHRLHHLDPLDIQWLLLRGVDAVVFQVMIAALVTALVVPLPLVVGGPLVAPALTAVVAGQVKLLEYEWDHFFFHTAYRPRTRWYRNRKRNHRLHHYRNEHYWLGVTHNFGDRVLGTLPGDKGAVPLSDTARTLDRDD